MSPSPLRLKNVLKQQSDLHQLLFKLASGDRGDRIQSPVQSLLSRTTDQIESICTQHQVTPAALAAPSRTAYAWMKFLTNENNLQLHLDTLRRAITSGRLRQRDRYEHHQNSQARCRRSLYRSILRFELV